MYKTLDENPMRRRILILLKKNGGMSIDTLSKLLKITPMGVRQHLMALEKKDLIVHDTVRQGVGRPSFIYRLSDRADDIFPKNYGKFVLQILNGIEEQEGREKVNELFQWRKNDLLGHLKESINGNSSVSERVRKMSDMLEADGYIIDLDDRKKEYVIKQYNCPISAVSRQFSEACTYELELYRDILGTGVQRAQCITEGGEACEYIIPKDTMVEQQKPLPAEPLQ